jgi:hypothetical protein
MYKKQIVGDYNRGQQGRKIYLLTNRVKSKYFTQIGCG